MAPGCRLAANDPLRAEVEQMMRDGAAFEERQRLALEDKVRRLGAGARERCTMFSWEHAQTSFAVVLVAALHGRRVDSEDPGEGDLEDSATEKRPPPGLRPRR